MSLSRDDAAKALEEIGQAGKRMTRFSYYAHAAPFFILWGFIWLIANTVADIAPRWTGMAWISGNVIGIAGTIFFSIRQARHTGTVMRESGVDGKAVGRRFAFLGFTLWCFFAALFVIVRPLDARQANALISIIWAFIYMGAGAFVGWRIFAIGLATAVAVMAGFLFVHEHYTLWMGAFAGGSLILGGLWLRKI